MIIVNKLSEAKGHLEGKRTAVALGTFDGVHIGHQSIIGKAVDLAKENDLVSVVYTFSNHPLTVVAPDRAPMQIGDSISKAVYLEEMGVDILLNISFNDKLAKQSPEEFLQLLQQNLRPRFVVTGPNFSFGYKGKGNPRMLVRVGGDYGFQAEIGKAVQLDGHMVSSTKIRQLIESGDLDSVNEYLGRYFCFGGRVVHGDHRGRTIGFPTANLAIPAGRAMLPSGAYSAFVLLDGKKYQGIANVGSNPTFEGCSHRLEVHILDFSGDIYDRAITVEFVSRLRGEIKFSGIEALVQQLHRDEAQARTLLDKIGK